MRRTGGLCPMRAAPGEAGRSMNWARTDLARTVGRYGLAILLSCAALLLRFAFDPLLDSALPYWTFWLAAAVAVWQLGVGPAILTAVLGLILGFYFFIPPRYTFDIAQPIDLAVFLAYGLVCTIICTLGGLMRAAYARIAAAAITAVEHKQRVEQEVSERKRSEALLRGIFDSAPVGIWILDSEGRIIRTNAASERIWSVPADHEAYTVRSLKGWWPATGKHLDDSEWPACRALSGGEAVLEQEIEIETFDGRRRCVVESAVPLRDEKGGLTGVVSVDVDITRRKQAEAALHQERARIALLHEAAAELLSPSGTEQQVQKIYEKVGGFLGADVFLEYATDETLLKRELVVSGGIPDDAQERLKHLQFAEAFCRSIPECKKPVSAYQVQEGSEPALQFMRGLGVRAYSVYPLLIGDRLLGSLAFASRKKDVFEAADEEVFRTVSHYVAVARERWRLTASLEAYARGLEKAVQERTASLEESSARLSGIVETAVDAIITFNDRAELETVNPAAERMFGYSRDELMGKDVKTLLAEPSRGSCGGNLDNYLATGQGNLLGITHEAVGTRKNGETFPMQLTVSEARLPNRRFFTGIVRDVTLRKKAEKRLQERSHELEQLSYSIIHDMRAPLRAMRSFGQMLQEDSAHVLDAESKDYLRRIIESAQRMDQLITDVFNFTAFMREGLPLSRLSPKPLLTSIVESYPEFDPEHADIQVAEHFPDVLANRGGLTQCFSNLLNNAVKFAKPGQKPVVRIWSEVRDGLVRLWFEDDGIGIERRHQERIFDMFQKLDARSGGTGIGLALVRKAVEKMHGSAGLESEPGKGSRFWIELHGCEVDAPQQNPQLQHV